MANIPTTVKQSGGLITKMAAQMLADKLQFVKNTTKVNENEYMSKNGYSAGDTIFINKPARFTPQNTFDITSSTQDIVEEQQALPLDIISTVGVELDSLEFATKLELAQLMERVIEPAMSAVAQDVESQMLTKATQFTANLVGTAGSTTFDAATVLSAKEKMGKYLTPRDNKRKILFDSTAGADAVVQRNGLFQSSTQIAKQYEDGEVGKADGFTWLENELLYQHTNGTDVTGVVIDSSVLTPATGASSIGVSGLTNTTGTITKGTVFTISSVFAVHPITKVTRTFLQQFTATALATANGSGEATVSISPTIYDSSSDGLQNVSALHANTDALVFSGTASMTYTQNLAFHKRAFETVFAPLVMPKKAEFAEMATVDGIRIAIIRDFDILERRMVTRIDVLGGLAPVRQEWAVRLTS